MLITQFRLLATLPTLLLVTSLAIADPLTEISTQLRGLHVTYDANGNAVRTHLYATNHEAYAVICDAEMKDNRDEKQKLTETRIQAGQTALFTFTHAKSITKIHVFLMCIPTEEKAVVEAKGKVEGATSEQADDRIVIKKLEKKADEPPKPVPVEDLGSF